MHYYSFNSLLRIAPLFFLMGCTASLQELQTIAPVAGDFSSSLAAEYLAYSESEAEQGRDFSAEHFAAKGLNVARGEDVVLDEVNKKTKSYDSLLVSRAALSDILSEDVKRVAPQKAARAQMLFDCWNEQENKKVPVARASCAEEFAIIYDDLQAIADDLAHGAYGKNIIGFYAGSTDLDAEAKYVIAKISKHLEKSDNYMLELDAHRNVKDAKSNKGLLAYKRLVAVRGELIKSGISPAKIFFAKPYSISSASVVHLSNDEAVENSNKIDIIITSSRHLHAVSK